MNEVVRFLFTHHRQRNGTFERNRGHILIANDVSDSNVMIALLNIALYSNQALEIMEFSIFDPIIDMKRRKQDDK